MALALQTENLARPNPEILQWRIHPIYSEKRKRLQVRFHVVKVAIAILIK
jgi:hypothetical protein